MDLLDYVIAERDSLREQVAVLKAQLARVLAPETVRLIMESQTSPDGRWAKACAVDACAALAAALAADAGPVKTIEEYMAEADRAMSAAARDYESDEDSGLEFVANQRADWHPLHPVSPEDMARVIGTAFDMLQLSCGKLRAELADWQQLCLRLYKEHVGDNSFDFAEKDWEGLMKETATKLHEAGLLKE